MESETKKSLHPRNVHNRPYDFDALIKATPALKPFVSFNKYHNLSIDFSDPQAVLLLNKALLAHFYHIKEYTISKDALCPPIPGRADYLHYLADLLSDATHPARGKKIRGLDIGTGANLIYPLLGHSIYEWSFVGVDVSEASLRSAKNIVHKNPSFKDCIDFRLQTNEDDIFFGVFHKDEYFDFTMCNPPFHKSQKEATSGTLRKNKNLGIKNERRLNFAGQANELWYPGGEIAFISKMIRQSAKRAKNCLWFSTLVSKKENLNVIYKVLKQVKALDIKTIEMKQGQKLTRIVAWTFLSKDAQNKWKSKFLD